MHSQKQKSILGCGILLGVCKKSMLFLYILNEGLGWQSKDYLKI